MRTRTVLAEIALTVGALLGLATMIITVAAVHTGIRPLVVRSGSMEPAIPTGSMVLVQRVDAGDIGIGDIVTVERPDHTRVTHRVVVLEPHGDTFEVTLKGDANEDPDPVPVTIRSADRLMWQAPMVGRALSWLATAQGGFAMGCLATAVAVRVLARRTRRGLPLPNASARAG
ncbi:MAG: signal peptidase I [Acidimicrobiia bacterium]